MPLPSRSSFAGSICAFNLMALVLPSVLGLMRLDEVKLPQIAADWQFIPSLAQQCQTHSISGRQRIELD